VTDIPLKLIVSPSNLAEELLTDYPTAEEFIKLMDKLAQDSGFTMRMAQYFTREIVGVYKDTDEPVTFDDLLNGPAPA
jgi:hypothetical protein